MKKTILMVTPGAHSDNKRGKSGRLPGKEFARTLKETIDINKDSTSKIYDMRSRRLVQRLRDEVLAQLMNYEIKPKS